MLTLLRNLCGILRHMHRNEKRVLHAFAILALAAGCAKPVRADCSPKLSDSTFQGGSIQLTFLGSTSHPASFFINRVVGPGTSSEFSAAGFLNNWQTYVDNGVLSATAELQVGTIHGIDFDPPPGSITQVTPWINGYPAGKSFNPEKDTCIKVSTEHMKFARRTPGQPQPDCTVNPAGCAENKVEMKVSACELPPAFDSCLEMVEVGNLADHPFDDVGSVQAVVRLSGGSHHTAGPFLSCHSNRRKSSMVSPAPRVMPPMV